MSIDDMAVSQTLSFTKPCQECGKPFSPKRASDSYLLAWANQKGCSRKCSGTIRGRERVGMPRSNPVEGVSEPKRIRIRKPGKISIELEKIKLCVHCGSEYHSRHPNSKTCSMRCNTAHRWKTGTFLREKNGRKPGVTNPNDYWGKDTDQKVKLYATLGRVKPVSPSDQKIRNMIWQKHLHRPVWKMCECLVNMHSRNNSSKAYINDLVSFACTHVAEKFDPDRGTNSFSYFTVCLKQQLFALHDKSKQNINNGVSIEGIIDGEVPGHSFYASAIQETLSRELHDPNIPDAEAFIEFMRWPGIIDELFPHYYNRTLRKSRMKSFFNNVDIVKLLSDIENLPESDGKYVVDGKFAVLRLVKEHMLLAIGETLPVTASDFHKSGTYIHDLRHDIIKCWKRWRELTGE